MKCKRCGSKRISKICNVCYEGMQAKVQQLRVDISPMQNNYKQTITIYATECNDREVKVGKITAFYSIIWLIVNLLKQYNKIVVTTGELMAPLKETHDASSTVCR